MSAGNADIAIKIALRNAAKFAADVRMERKEIRGLGDDTAKAGRKAAKASVEYTIFGAALRQTPIAGAIAGVGLLAQVLAAGGLATVGFVAALVPLVGVLGALPAIAMLAGQGLGVVKLAFVGIKQATGGLNAAIDPKKFAALTRPGQNLVLLLDALKPRVRSLQAALQGGLFPGLTAGLLAAAPALTALKGPLTGTGVVLGLVAAHLGALVGSRGFLNDLSSQTKFNNVQLGRLGGAGIHVVNMLRNLMVGSRSLVGWLVKLTAGWAATGDRMTAAGRRSGGLQRGFHTVQVTLSRVGRLLWSLGVALFNVRRIGKAQLGDGILVYLLKGATAFERWTSSARGVASITAAFAGARDVLHEVAHWLRVAREAAGPGLGDAIHNLADALKPLLNSGGGPSTLGLYVTGLSRLASAAGWIERNVPGASFALSGLATVLLASKLPFIGSGIAYTGKAMLFLGKAIVLTAAQTRIGAATFWLLNGALVGLRTAAAAAWVAVTGPVGLVVLAIAAVIGVAVLLYNKWGWFHRAVDNTFAFIRDHWPRLLAILTGPIGLAVLFVVQHFDQIKAKVGSVIDWMGRKIRGILNLAGRVKDGVLGLPGKLLGKARSILPFAHGGIVGSPLQLVGERGPELAALPMGSRVFTAPQTQTMLRAPRTATVHYGGGNAGSAGEGRPIHLHTTNVVQLDGKVLAKSMSTEVAREHGRRG